MALGIVVATGCLKTGRLVEATEGRPYALQSAIQCCKNSQDIAAANLWKMSMSSVAIMVGSLSLLARIAASAISKLS